MERRHFLRTGIGITPSLVGVPVFSQFAVSKNDSVDANAARAVLILAVRMQVGTPRFAPIILGEALKILPAASNPDRVIQDFRLLNERASAVSSNAMLNDLLETPEARRHRLGEAITKAVDRGEITVLGGKMSEVIRRDINGLVPSVSNQIARLLKEGGTQAARAYSLIHVVHQIPSMPTSQDVADVLRSGTPFVAPAQSIIDIASHGVFDSSQINRIAEEIKTGVQTETEGRLRGVLTTVMPRDLQRATAVVTGVSALTALTAQGLSENTWLRQSAALQGILAATGNSDAARFTAQATQYVQSGMAVYQSAMLLAGAATGWGAVVAMAGMANALGGLGAFGGGGGGDNGAQKRHEELVAAISSLFNYVEQQFKVVNENLVTIATRLDESIKLLKTIGADVKRLQQDLLGVSRDLRLVLHNLSEVEWRTVNRDYSDPLDSTCKNWALPGAEKPSRNELNTCWSKYALATRYAKQPPYQEDSQNAHEQDDLLLRAFSRSARPEISRDGWRSLTVLAAVLGRFGVSVSAPTPHPMLITWAVDGYSSLAERYQTDFQSMSGSHSNQVGEFRSAFDDFKSFVRALRDVSGPAPKTNALERLRARYEFLYQRFARGWNKLVEVVVVNQYMINVERPAGTPIPEVKLGNASGPVLLFTGAELSAISPYYSSTVSTVSDGVLAVYADTWNCTSTNIMYFPLNLKKYQLWIRLRLSVGELHFDTFEVTMDVVFPATVDLPTGNLAYVLTLSSNSNPLVHLEDPVAALKRRVAQQIQLKVVKDRAKNARIAALHSDLKLRLKLAASVWVSASPDFEDASDELRSIDEMGVVLAAMRGVAKIAYPNTYASFDFAQACLEGADGVRLPDREWVNNFARAVLKDDRSSTLGQFIRAEQDAIRQGNTSLPAASPLGPTETSILRALVPAPHMVHPRALRTVVETLSAAGDNEGELIQFAVGRQLLSRLPL